MFLTPQAEELTGDSAWLQAMLDAEAALAAAQGRVGVIPAPAAASIRAVCRAGLFDAQAIGAAAAAAGNPAIPLVEALRTRAETNAADFVHFGATSQDIIDTAAMLVAARALDSTLGGLRSLADRCAELAEQHRTTLMAGRTLLQHAVPTTFGLVAAGWLNGVVDAGRRLTFVRNERLAVQLGGAAGTLASLGVAGPSVTTEFAAELGLKQPVLPWQSSRGRATEIAGALVLAASAVEKVALDVLLLSQSEIAEVSETGGAGAGRSSAMPQKRNAVGAMAVRASAIQARGFVATLIGLDAHEHQRAAGSWQAGWIPLSDALAFTLSAVHRGWELADGLAVDAARMRANLDLTGGLVMAEAVSGTLGKFIGLRMAQELVHDCAAAATATRRPFALVLATNPTVARHLSAAEIDELLQPASYLGSNDLFIDRAIEDYRSFAPLPAVPR
jgi:3-carboxy-cis,cis-muconate cycloisomerase